MVLSVFLFIIYYIGVWGGCEGVVGSVDNGFIIGLHVWFRIAEDAVSVRIAEDAENAEDAEKRGSLKFACPGNEMLNNTISN